MSHNKETGKTSVRSEDKKVEHNQDLGRGMRNSMEKSKSEIPVVEDRSKQSKSEKTTAKPQATQDDTSTSIPKFEPRRRSVIANEDTPTCSTKNEKKKDSVGKTEEHLIPARISKRSRKSDRISTSSKEDKEQSTNGLATKSSTSSKSHSPTTYGVDISRHLRSKVDFTPGARLEARDFTERWYAAKVVEVDWEEEEVLVHFEKWSSRFDEWISMDSPRLRPPTLATNSSRSKNNQFREGEKVMAFWLDRQKYPAKVLKVLPNDNYEIMFYDGYTKTVSGKRMVKATEKELEKAKKEMPKPNMSGQAGETPPVQHTSIFTETDIGTKEDRRRRKRKLNVAGLFSKHHRQSATKKGEEEVKKVIDDSVKEAERTPQSLEKSDSKGDSQNDDESPEEGRLVYDSEDDMEENSYSPQPVEPTPESSSPPRGKGMRTKFKPPSKDIKETQSSRKRKIQAMDDSSTDFLRLRFKSRKTTPVAKKRLDLPEEKETEIQVPSPELPKPYRKQIKEPIHVPDKRLPAGWRKFAIKRKIGASAGKWDIYMQSPDGRKIRSPHALRAFFAKRGVDNINLDRFDFAPSKAVFPRDGGRPALALSPQEIHAALEEKTPSKPSSPGPPMRLSAGGPKVLLPKVHSGVHPVAKRLKTLMPRARSSTGEGSGEIPLQPDSSFPADVTEAGATWKETNCKMDSTYVCPKEGCGKNFRKENLLQMHIKHYHPEYCKLVGSAPNVADLASARMDGGESVFDFRPARVSRTPPVEPSGRGGGRGRGRWLGIKRGGNTSRPVESSATSPSKSKSITDSPGVNEADNRWEVPTSNPTIKTLMPVRPSESQGEVCGPDGTPPEVEAAMQDGVQLVQEVVSDTPVIQSPLSRRRLMGVGRRKRRLTFLPTHMAKRRKFAMKSSLSQGDSKTSVEGEENEGAFEVVSSQKGSVNTKRLPVSVADGKVPVVQLQKLKVTTDSQGIKAEASTERETRASERTTVSSLAVSSVGSGVRRRRKRKSELLSREEIVNCVCGSPEEDGLMMQCELCLCWQHGHCNNIEREVEVPEKYVCYICLNPQKERKSMKYFHDQDWLKKGILPSLSFRNKEDETKANQRFKVLKKSHELTGSLLQLKTVVHSLRVKVNMIGNNDHPKLYLWSKSWEASPTPNDVPELCGVVIKEESEKLEPPPPCSNQPSYGDITKTEDNLPELTMEQGTLDEKDKDIPSLDCEVAMASEELQKNQGLIMAREADDSSASLDCLSEDKKGSVSDTPLDTSATLSATSDDLKRDQHEEALGIRGLSLTEESSKIDSDLMHGHAVGDDDCPPVLELPLSQSELQQLANTVEDKLRSSALLEVRAPQPEAPIDPMECQLTLLDHIESMQQEVDSRLTLIEAQVAALEAEDDDIASDEPPEFYPHTKQTMQMIMRDLNTARRIAAFCGKS
ncbi:PHD finger protein 20-like isoform X2 [Hetaerina americana]|uniref:PHD finger protein 20-like isoform X2 n=1 Tax=Hetaerina americana TaxID=62018 RepID=UPI003A7F1198